MYNLNLKNVRPRNNVGLVPFPLPKGQDLQSWYCFPGAWSYATKDPVGHVLHVFPTWPRVSE